MFFLRQITYSRRIITLMAFISLSFALVGMEKIELTLKEQVQLNLLDEHSPEELLRLGEKLYQEKEYAEAWKCFDEVANQSVEKKAEAWALMYLSFMYLSGEGGNVDLKEAKVHLAKVHNVSKSQADLGYVAAYVNKIEKRAKSIAEDPKNMATLLHLAAEYGHLEMIDWLLKIGASTEAPDRNCWTPLFWAAAKGRLGIVKRLLESGASLHQWDYWHKGPAYYACKNGHTNVIKFLLESYNDSSWEAELSTAAKHGHTDIMALLLAKVPAQGIQLEKAFLEASANGHLSTVALLMQKIENQKIVDEALHKASANNYIDVVLFLLENGANIKASDSKGHTALYRAALNDHPAMVELLVIKGARLSRNKIHNLAGPSILYNKKSLPGCHEKRIKIVEFLIRKGGDASIIGEDGWTVLHWAADCGSKEVADWALENGATIDALYRGDTPLHLAAGSDHVNIVKLLIEKGCKRDLKNLCRHTPLLHAVRRGNYNTTKLLAKDQSTDEKNGALCIAARGGYTKIVQYLLNHGANVQGVYNGKTALNHASQAGHAKIVRILITNGADVNTSDSDGYTSLSNAAYNGHKEVVLLLLQEKCSLQATLKNSWTPLHASLIHNHYHVAQLLLSSGADTEARNCWGYTPLHIAAARDVLSVELLLKYGAKVNAKNRDNNTPLHIATEKGLASIVALLLENGAVESVNAAGKSPLSLAIEKGDKGIVQQLIEKGTKNRMWDKLLLLAKKKAPKSIVTLLQNQDKE